MLQTQWNLFDGFDIGRDILTRFAIAACGRLYQHAVFVAQTHGQAVEFRLGHIFHGGSVCAQAQFAPHARIKSLRTAGLGIGFGFDAEHGLGMAHRGKTVQHRAQNPLRRRISAYPIRVLGFYGL